MLGGIFGDRPGSVLAGEVDGNPRHRLATGADLRAGPLFMSVAVQVLAHQLPVGRLRAVARVAGAGAAVAVVGVLVEVVAPLSRPVAESAIALAIILILFSQLLSGVGLWRRMRLTLPLVIAGLTVPAVLSGGLPAARFGERAWSSEDFSFQGRYRAGTGERICRSPNSSGIRIRTGCPGVRKHCAFAWYRGVAINCCSGSQGHLCT